MEFLGKIKFKIKYYSARILLYLFVLPKNSTDLYNDLIYWYPLADIIMGDDYGTAYPEIKIALDKFCKERNLKYKTLHYQWWLRKS